MTRFFTSLFSQSRASWTRRSKGSEWRECLAVGRSLTKSSESSDSMSSPSVTFSEPTRASTLSASLACRSLAMLASRSISSQPGSINANGSYSSSSSPSHELLEILDRSMSPPSSEPRSLSSFSPRDSEVPKTSEKSSSSSSANF